DLRVDAGRLHRVAFKERDRSFEPPRLRRRGFRHGGDLGAAAERRDPRGAKGEPVGGRREGIAAPPVEELDEERVGLRFRSSVEEHARSRGWRPEKKLWVRRRKWGEVG